MYIGPTIKEGQRVSEIQHQTKDIVLPVSAKVSVSTGILNALYRSVCTTFEGSGVSHIPTPKAGITTPLKTCWTVLKMFRLLR